MARATGAGAEGVDKAWKPFAGINYERARDKAHQLFADSSAVHLHGMRSSEKAGGLVNAVGPDDKDNDEVSNPSRKEGSGYLSLAEALQRETKDGVSDVKVDVEDDDVESCFDLSQEEVDGLGIGSVVKEQANEDQSHDTTADAMKVTEKSGVTHGKIMKMRDPILSLSERRRQSVAAIARRTALANSIQDSASKQGKQKEVSESSVDAATRLFVSMNKTESIRHDSVRLSENGMELKATEESGEARARAKSVEAQTLRDNLTHAMKIMESSLAPAAKALMLRPMGLVDLAAQCEALQWSLNK